MNYRTFSLITIITCTLLLSCAGSKHKKLLKSQDHDAKYEAAVKSFEKEDYFHATQLFENLILYYRGRDKAENVNLYYAKSLLGSKDYYSAGYQFENFTRWFPYSKDAEYALFQAAYCKYIESPKHSLDQTLTKESLKQFQSYIDKYPHSENVKKANQYMDELRGKLIKKDYETAYNYFKTGKYQSAQFALKNFLNEYPDAPNREDAMYFIIIAGYEFAKNSIEDKRIERLKWVISDYEKFLAFYPESKKIKKLETINNLCLTELNKI